MAFVYHHRIVGHGELDLKSRACIDTGRQSGGDRRVRHRAPGIRCLLDPHLGR